MAQAASDSVIVAEFQEFLAENHSVNIATTLACYEYIFGLDREILLLWQRRWTSVTWLFLANRYFMLAAVIAEIAPYTPQTLYRCNAATLNTLSIAARVPVIVVAIFSALRVFTLLDRNYRWAVLVLCLGLVPVATDGYFLSKTSYYFVHDTVLGASCYNVSGLSASTVSLGNRLSIIVADIIVVVVTWLKTFRQARQAASLGIKGVSSILLRDGSVYFIALVILNIAQLLVDIVPALQIGNPVSSITTVVQQILISRFLTNLRQASEGPSAASSSYDHGSSRVSHHLRVPTSLAVSIVEPAGEPLEFGHPAAPWDDLDEQYGTGMISGDRPLESASPNNASPSSDHIKPDSITV